MIRSLHTVLRVGQTRRTCRTSTIALAACALIAACAGDDSDVVVVLAAASLSDVFAQIETDFEAQYPGVDVQLSVGGSNTLVTQVENGAPADVIALADESLMNELVDGEYVDTVRIFASNDIAIAVPVGNPGEVTSIDDFTRGELFLGACAKQVPCGRYAQAAFDVAGIDAALDTEAPDVRSLVTQLLARELDAGVVYRTDIAANAGELAAIELSSDAAIRYPIAVAADAGNHDAARQFAEFVQSDAQGVLAAAGFGAP